MTLLLYILEYPGGPDAEADAQLLSGFRRQVRRMHNDGDFQMPNLLKAYLGLEHLANIAIGQAQSDEGLEARFEPSQDAFPHHDLQVRIAPHSYRQNDLLMFLLDIQRAVEFSHSSNVPGPRAVDQPAKPGYRNLSVYLPHPRGAPGRGRSIRPARSRMYEAWDIWLWLCSQGTTAGHR